MEVLFSKPQCFRLSIAGIPVEHKVRHTMSCVQDPDCQWIRQQQGPCSGPETTEGSGEGHRDKAKCVTVTVPTFYKTWNSLVIRQLTSTTTALLQSD